MLTEQVVSDAAGDKEQVLLPGDFVLNRRLRTVKLTKQGMKHALQYLRASPWLNNAHAWLLPPCTRLQRHASVCHVYNIQIGVPRLVTLSSARSPAQCHSMLSCEMCAALSSCGGSQLRQEVAGARRPLGGGCGLGPVHHHGPQGAPLSELGSCGIPALHHDLQMPSCPPVMLACVRTVSAQHQR